MTPELIGALVVAVTGLIGGITGILSKRSEDQRRELEQMRRDYRYVRQQLRYADQWIFLLTRSLDQNGVQAPEPPKGLEMSHSTEEGSQ